MNKRQTKLAAELAKIFSVNELKQCAMRFAQKGRADIVEMIERAIYSRQAAMDSTIEEHF